MAQKSSYETQVDAKNLQKIKALLSELPLCVSDFVNARFTNMSTRTLLQYCYSLRKFFSWMRDAIPHLRTVNIHDITLDDIANLTAKDLEEFMLYLQMDPAAPNSRASVAQKLHAVSSLFGFLYRHGDIPADPSAKVERPKAVQDKRIIYLTDDECVELLNTIAYGSDNITPHQAAYLEATRCRDLAITTLLLNTGIRLSECVGLNIPDIDLKNQNMQVFRKGGKFQYIPLNDEVVEVLQDYIEKRKLIEACNQQSKDALFLSMSGGRMTGPTIENMIRKYVLLAGITKPITPHKLRKTFGTALYKKSRDVYMTANALGHENVATTTKHYVDDSAESLRKVINEMQIGSN